MRRMHCRNELPYPRRLGSALLIPLVVGVLGAAAPAAAQSQGACDQYLPNCEPRGDDPRGSTGGQQSAGPSESLPGQDSTVSPAQSGGGTGGNGSAGNSAGTSGDRGGLAGLSSAANAGAGDAGGGDLLGADYPLTGWMAVVGALLLGLAALLAIRHVWGALHRRGAAATD